ncbi:MAG: UDP-3-O-(3-hydroxymyristoyl)glucosamine N-acyltransferase [Planctomycetia bacterium]|nr:UDP-3-O-(3-hydroxymyristoyl)glucosamine N-acyltransferase [Planctomycetia bacterium]
MAHTLGELARLVDGIVHGDPHQPITGASPIMTAAAGELTLIDKPERLKKLAGSRAAAVLAPPAVIEACGTSLPVAAIEVADAHGAFAKIIAAFRPQRASSSVGISPQAVISPSARVAAGVDIHPGAVIGAEVEIETGAVIHSGAQIMAGSKIGEGTVVFPNAVLYENTIVGPRSIIHAGAVLGAYGFGYKLVAGKHQLTSQLGHVELGSDVEVGANMTIDRGTYGPTRIGEGTKLDDQVMIGHNCVIGKHNLICSQVGIAGSTSTGDYVVMAGQAGLRDHIHIGDKAVLGAMSGVMNDVAAGAVMLGIPATPERDQMLILATVQKLPEMRKQIKALEKSLAQLLASQAVQAPRTDDQAAA